MRPAVQRDDGYVRFLFFGGYLLFKAWMIAILANVCGVAAMFCPHLCFLLGRALAAEQIIGVPGTWSGSSSPDNAAGRGARQTLRRGQERPVFPRPGPD